jgi:hypothetical protein
MKALISFDGKGKLAAFEKYLKFGSQQSFCKK